MRAARAVAAAIALASMATRAQAMPVHPPPRPAPAPAPTTAKRVTTGAPSPTDLRARFGVERADALVHEGSAEELLRGVERAAAIGTTDAIALVASFAGSSDPRVRIAVARGLAAHAEQSRAREALFLVVTSDPPRARPNEAETAERDALFEHARRIAALALARSSDSHAGEKLVTLARVDAAGTRIAIDALAQFPPRGATTAWTAPMTAGALELARRTGDLRALEPALEAARSADRATRAAAIETLGAMGDGRVAAIAQQGTGDPDVRVRVAAAAALVAVGAPSSADAVEKLLGDAGVAPRAIALARDAHSPGIARALARIAAGGADRATRDAALEALGRDPSGDAVDALVALVADPLLGVEAADALARSPSPRAMDGIASITKRLGNDARARRIAARAYVVRRGARGERSDAMDGALAALAKSDDGRDRAIAAFARVALDGAELAALLGDRDARVRRAAILASLARPADEATGALLARFATEDDDAARVALGAALAGGDPAGHVPTRALLGCARAGGPDAPMCALAFAARAAPRDDEAVDALFASSDPIVRAHVARGLALSSDATRTGRLAAGYAYEPSPLVRAAVLASLGRGPRDAPPAKDALDFAARFDPDARCRAIAERALAGLAPVDLDAGPRDLAWVHLVDASGGPMSPASSLDARAAYVLRPDGLAVPIVFDDDGDALVPGVPAGEARLVLAPRAAAAYSESP